MARNNEGILKRESTAKTSLQERKNILGGDDMATATQVTLIICMTLIILSLINRKGGK